MSEEEIIIIEDEEDLIDDLIEEADRILNLFNFALVTVGGLLFSISVSWYQINQPSIALALIQCLQLCTDFITNNANTRLICTIMYVM